MSSKHKSQKNGYVLFMFQTYKKLLVQPFRDCGAPLREGLTGLVRERSQVTLTAFAQAQERPLLVQRMP